ncbi:MAG: hypothetical protein FD168_1399 [Desulfobulbaceae bacterium]|nr:MAG: hypothetical protein FD168_1399 [Desulfobulbaceae bacterium]
MILQILDRQRLSHCSNEKGFVLIVAMLMLLVISLMGIFMSNTTTTEVIIAGNERHSQEQFFKADAGVNVVIAENTVPGDGFKPGTLYTPPALPFNCNTPLHLRFAHYDIDGVAGDEVNVFLLEKSASTPVEIQVASCVTENNTTAQIIAGIQYGANLGRQKGTGDPNEYSN